MKLKVLVDNNTYIDKYYYGEPALSLYLEINNQHILFDSGYSDIFIKNSELMNIDLHNIDTIVLSHGHNDHSNGLYYLNKYMDTKNIKLITHPDALNKKYDNNLYVGMPYDYKNINNYYDVCLTKDIYHINDNLLYLGQIPRYQYLPQVKPVGKQLIDNNLVDDYLYDDSGLVYHDDKGIFIIAGCSHSGICNIIEYAKEVTGINHIYGVIGGFHLLENNDVLDNTIKYLKDNDIEQLYPCHCVSLYVKSKMIQELKNVNEVGVSLTLDI